MYMSMQYILLVFRMPVAVINLYITSAVRSDKVCSAIFPPPCDRRLGDNVAGCMRKISARV